MYNLSVIRELRVAPLHNIPSRPVLISNIMGGVSVLLIMLAVIVLSATTTQWRSIIKANLEKAIPNGTKEVSVIQFYFGCCGRGEDVPTEAWKSLVFQRGNLYSNSMSHPNYLPWSCCNIANEGLCHNIGWERYAIKYTESTWNTEHGPNRTLKVDEHGVGADFKKMVSWQEEGVHSVYAGENCEQAVFWGMVKEVFIPVPILFFIMAFFSAATTILIFNSAKFIREDSEKSFPQRKGPKDGESGKSDGSKGACTEDGVKKEDGDKKKEGDKQLTSRIHALSAKPTASQMQASSAKPLASRMEASSAKPAASRMQASSATKVASRIHALSAKPTASQMQASSAKPLASRMEASSAKPAASRMQASTATKVASQMQVSRANQGPAECKHPQRRKWQAECSHSQRSSPTLL
ncbi:hypothetical protein L596_008625 [Steinernema carpocapsae]|uniref:Tetraspanin n=1 Tax=Steinernema carpocapsae TaxID=34508 RepID=A0A4U5PDB8_STECR|nr:hypothetical protein L596_008625 [Steinernema carpocapsae]